MKFNKLNKCLLTAGMLTMIAISPVSNAAIINDMFGSGLNTMQDQDAERIMRNGVAVTSGQYQVGDVIQAILRFDSVNGITIGDQHPSPYQLIGYSELRINNIANLGDVNGDGFNEVRLTFGATGNLGAGVMVELYERTNGLVAGYVSNAAPATGINNITSNGHTLIAELGFSDANDFWGATSVDNIAVLAGAQAGSGQAAGGEFGISVLNNPGVLPIGENSIFSAVSGQMHDVVGDLSIFARETGVNSGWLLSSNINASFQVPEPTSLALLALGLFGMGVARRGNNKA